MHNKHSYLGQKWAVPLFIALISLIFQLFDLFEALRYERELIEQGQIWRLLSGNFVHLGWSHFVLNIAGLGLIWLIFSDLQSGLQWSLDVAFAALIVGLGLYCFNPELIWYVGLSGLLHGLFVLGLLLDRSQNRGVLLLVLFGFIAKLVWEQSAGALPGSESFAGGPVIVDAHLYGSFAGLIAYGYKQVARLI